MGKLDNKVAIVTGAGQGIGQGVALAFAKEGATVVVAEINEKTANSTADELRDLGGKALAVTCDVAKQEDVEKVVQATIDEYGAIDVLVNNAQDFGRCGSFGAPPFEEVTEEDWDACMKSGLMGTFYFMKACFPHMKEKGGKIINFASVGGVQRWVGMSPYAAAKEGIRAITGVAAREWAKYGIIVNVVCPGGLSPTALKELESFPDQMEVVLQNILLGRIGDCEKDVGRAIVFLAGSDSDYITGQTIHIGGGIDIHA